MGQIWRGAPVAAALDAQTALQADALKALGVSPKLAILRVGERADDLAYERGATKRCANVGVDVQSVVLPADTPSAQYFAALQSLNDDPCTHGVLLLQPLPKHIDAEAARGALKPDKDVDGCTDGSLAGVFANTAQGFPPCTAQAAMETLRYYGVDCAGKRAAVIGRSLVVGRPVAMLLMHANATVTVCHTRTQNVAAITREADIVVVCAGRMETVGAAYFSPGQTVLDVGVGWNGEKGKLCGDVRFDEVSPIVSAITPVPGGVGSVTSAVLASHVVEAARRAASK